MRNRRSFFVTIISIITVLFLLFFLSTCKGWQTVKMTEEYKAVFLDNGQVYFGKIEEQGSTFILLKDVFYIQSQIVQKDKDTREVKNVLIKRGSEWHGPDRMYINVSHVVLIEPVSPDSRVAQLIRESKPTK